MSEYGVLGKFNSKITSYLFMKPRNFLLVSLPCSIKPETNHEPPDTKSSTLQFTVMSSLILQHKASATRQKYSTLLENPDTFKLQKWDKILIENSPNKRNNGSNKKCLHISQVCIKPKLQRPYKWC